MFVEMFAGVFSGPLLDHIKPMVNLIVDSQLYVLNQGARVRMSCLIYGETTLVYRLVD